MENNQPYQTGLGYGLRAVLLDSELGARFSGLASLQDGRGKELMMEGFHQREG